MHRKRTIIKKTITTKEHDKKTTRKEHMQLNAFKHKEQKSRINKHRTLRFRFATDPITAHF